MTSESLAAQAASSLEQQASRALSGNSYLSPQYRLDVREKEGRLMLRGKVGSYFHKQMAQEVLRTVAGVERIDNLLEVT